MEKIQKEDKISTFAQLGNFLLKPENGQILQQWYSQARNANGWFTEDNCQLACQAIAKDYLNYEKLNEFSEKYGTQPEQPLKVGIVAAGNIPFVGLHDMICTILSGHHALLKLSRDDMPLMLNLIEKLKELNPLFKDYVQVVERLNEADAFIATGSDNSSRYFEYYFKKKPHIIRKNRTSVAVLTGAETGEDLRNLGNDIFQYFGLGCRNVSKLYVPKNYKFDFFYESIAYWNTIQLHHKYNNNYDYNKSIYLVNRVEHLDNGFLLLKEDDALVSPLSVLFFEKYSNENQLNKLLHQNQSKIQCTIGEENSMLPFGQAQSPQLTSFADGIDTMKFLENL